jgi:hypothetical protein
MTMKGNSSNNEVSSQGAVWEMSCQEMTKVIIDDNETSMGWREFQEEIKKNEFVTTVGVKQILAKALQARVEELDRRARVQEDTWASEEEEQDNALREEEEEPELDIDIDELFSSQNSNLRGPSSWSDPFRNLAISTNTNALATDTKKVNKRGTMNMLMSGLGDEVQESVPPQASPNMNRRGSVVATNLNRRGSTTMGLQPNIARSPTGAHNPSPSTSSRRLTGAHSPSPSTSSRRLTGAHSPSLVSSSRRMSVNPTTSRRLSVALSPKTTHKMSTVTASARNLSGGAKETTRRGSMFADMMRLEDEQKFSISQAINNGTYINRRGSNGIDLMSTTDYSDVIHRKDDDDDDCAEIKSFKRLDSGKYATASKTTSPGYFGTAIDSALDTAKSMIEVAKSA